MASPVQVILVAVGYGVANLGYLLVGAGLLAGSFRAVRLIGRGRVIGAGVAAWLLGTVLGTIGANLH